MRGTGSLTKTNKGKAAPAVLAVNDNGILAHDLMVEVTGTVRVFGGRRVLVGFHGEDAYCNDSLNYVNIPKIPDATIIPTPIARIIRGFADHETGHLIWTDFTAYKALCTPEEIESKLFHAVWNSIEDFMIERNWLELWPGSHKNLTATEIRCCEKYLDHYQQNPDIAKDLRIIGHLALTWCRAMFFNLKTDISRKCLQTLPADLQKRVWEWFDMIIDTESTAENIEHARVIFADIGANPFDPNNMPADPNAGQGGPQGQPQPGGNGQGAFSATLTPGTSQQPDPLELGNALADALSDLGVNPGNRDDAISYEVLTTTEFGPDSDTLADHKGAAKARKSMDNIGGTIGTVSRVLKRVLQSISKDRWKGGRADGLIDDKRLAGVMLGQTEIYKKMEKAPKIDTAVEILVDCSGSMDGSKLALCQQLGLVMQAAFAGTPIKFEIIGYTSGDLADMPDDIKIQAQAFQQQYGTQANVRGIQIYEFKHFDAPYHVALTTLGNMTSVRTGGTPTGEAILIAHERLGRRPERRHVMFVLTDGEPDDDQYCVEAVKAVESCKVSVLGFGISSAAVKKAFRNYVVLNNAADLAAVVLTTIGDMLFKDRYQVGKRPQVKSQSIRQSA